MNILMLTPKLDIGGAEKMMLYTARGLIKDGYRVYIAGEKGSMEKYFEAAGARVYDYPLNQNSKKVARSLKLMFDLRGLCKKRDIDIIYCHHRWPAFLALYASKTLKVPLVYHCHSRIKHKGIFSVWGDRTIAVSHDLEDYLVKSFGRKRETIKVVYNGVPELRASEEMVRKVKDELEQNFNIDFRFPIVGTVARLISDKGLEYFIQSIPLILEERPGVQFLIIGEGERKADLMKLAREMKVSQNTFFIGEIGDVIPYLELMNIFVLPSLSEGMGVSNLEALSLAKPVVVTRVGGVPELIEDGVNGLLIKSRSPSALANAVTLLLDDKALASRLGLKGREVVRNQFTVERMVKEVEKVFSELKKGRQIIMEDKISLFGIKIDNLTREGAIKRIEELISQRRCSYVLTPNVHHIVTLEKDDGFREVYSNADLIIPDGMPLVWISRLLGRPLKERLAGSDLLVAFCDVAARKRYKLFFLGGSVGAPAKAAKILIKKNPGLRIVGTHCPPFGFENEKEESKRIVEIIKRAKPDVLFIGLGAPKQEKWIGEYREDYQVPVSITIGAAFDFTAQKVRRAPVWIQKIGWEWLFRVSQEPARLWRRYFLEDSIFIWLAFRELLRRM